MLTLEENGAGSYAPVATAVSAFFTAALYSDADIVMIFVMSRNVKAKAIAQFREYKGPE
jgi:hypothetical protein